MFALYVCIACAAEVCSAITCVVLLDWLQPASAIAHASTPNLSVFFINTVLELLLAYLSVARTFFKRKLWSLFKA